MGRGIRFSSTAWLAALVALGPLLQGAFAPALARISRLDHLYSFGDSLSDGGNSGITTGNATGVVFPPPPYAGGRVSNGPVAIEQLWRIFHPGGDPPASGFLPSLAGGSNYAVSGATTGVDNFNTYSPGVPALFQPAFANLGNANQLQAFLAGNPAPDPAHDLFLIWLFPNDLLGWSLNGNRTPGTFDGQPGVETGPGPEGLAALIGNGIQNITGSVLTLAAAGGTQFLVPNMPDLGLTPLFLGTPEAEAISAASQAFNNALGASLAQLQSALPQTEIVAFESDDLFAEILSEPESFGLENVTQSCLANAAICDPERWFFWDDFHPTTAGHRLIAERWAAAVAEPVPGPLGLLAPPLLFHWSRRLRRRLQRRIQLPKNQP